MKALCNATELAETGVRVGQIRRGLKAVAMRDADSNDDVSTESEASWTTAPMETALTGDVVDGSLDWIDVLFQDEELASWIPMTMGESTEADLLGNIDDRCLDYLSEILDSADFAVGDS
ncbi:hypothetical protein PybrP1_007879 [[Pythium] brassicae (nom. inval.)]|nr:hypothetical protein PybrP1_007879 [[Pythium] brassicae (nom. inval.)]